MAISLHQKIRVGAYIIGRHLRRVERYPLVLMLEPLFRCNLACAGCGKIDYPDPILNQRLSVDECLEAVEECGAPVVVIAGGEPLLHHEIDQIRDFFGPMIESRRGRHHDRSRTGETKHVAEVNCAQRGFSWHEH